MSDDATPGPWAWRWKSGSLHRVACEPFTIYGDAVLSPSYEYDSGVETIVSDADARLIAAAPDLLAALEDMASGWRYIRRHYGDLAGVGWDRAQSAAEAAIAKARGVQNVR